MQAPPEPPPRSSLRPRSALLPPAIAAPAPRSSSLVGIQQAQKASRNPGAEAPGGSYPGGAAAANSPRRVASSSSMTTKTSPMRKPVPPMDASLSTTAKSISSPSIMASTSTNLSAPSLSSSAMTRPRTTSTISRSRTTSTAGLSPPAASTSSTSSRSRTMSASSSSAAASRSRTASSSATPPISSPPATSAPAPGGLSPAPRPRTTSASSTAASRSKIVSSSTTPPTSPPVAPGGLSPAPRSRTTSTSSRSRTVSSSVTSPTSPPATRSRTALSATPSTQTQTPISRSSAPPVRSSQTASAASAPSATPAPTPASPSSSSALNPSPASAASSRIRKPSTGGYAAPTASASTKVAGAKSPARSVSASASGSPSSASMTRPPASGTSSTSTRTAPMRSVSASASVSALSSASSQSLRSPNQAPPRAMRSPSTSSIPQLPGQSPSAHVQAFASAREAIRRGRERSGVSSPISSAGSPVSGSPVFGSPMTGSSVVSPGATTPNLSGWVEGREKETEKQEDLLAPLSVSIAPELDSEKGEETPKPEGSGRREDEMAAILAKAIVEDYEYDWAAVSITGEEESQSEREKVEEKERETEREKEKGRWMGRAVDKDGDKEDRGVMTRTRSRSRGREGWERGGTDPPFPPSPAETTLLLSPTSSKLKSPREPRAALSPPSNSMRPTSPPSTTARPNSPPPISVPPKSPSRTRSVESGPQQASRSQEHVPFPEENVPTVPSSPSSPLIGGSTRGHDVRENIVPAMLYSSTQQYAATNAHIPLAMQSRSRNTSDNPRAAALLVTAATRAPGSPPQRTQTLAQAQAVASPPSQRTPERPHQLLMESSERKDSLRTAEGSIRAPPELTLDVKRLMSKPSAVRNRTDSSDGSMGGESEGGLHLRRKRYDAAGRRVGRVPEGAVPQNSSRRTLSEDNQTADRKEDDRDWDRDRAEEKKARDVARAFMGPLTHSGGEEKEKRQKNVLRRRPSASRPSTAPASSPSPSPAIPSVSAGPPVLSLNLSLKPMNFADGEIPRSPNGGSPGSGKLTPAGAVAQAYKRGLTPSPSASPLPSPSLESKLKAFSDRGHGVTPSPPVTPYYTVFGSTSGRVVAVGGPEDSWDGAGSYISATAFPGLDPASRVTKISSGSSTVGRSLTRKVSERWGRKREDPSEDDVRGRSSTQSDRRGKKIMHSGSRSAGEEVPSPGGEPDWATSSSDAATFKNEPRSRRSEPALGGGNKIWKLMKRISTGGLKEKYDRGPRTLPPIPPLPPMPDLPPVPRLPQDLQTRSTMSSDGHPQDNSGALSRFMQSRSSMSVSPSTSGIPRPSTRSLPMPPPIPASQPRGSTTTRSSSPMSSSDVASSKYFHKTASSTRSSTSSYGEEASAPPPMPDVLSLLGKHIVPPKELHKLEVNVLDRRLPDEKKTASSKPKAFFGTQTIRSTDDWTIVNTPAEEKPPSLPHPPRRLPMPSAYSESSRLTAGRRLSETPSIPEFSTTAPINDFATRKPVQPVAEPMAAPPPRRSTDDSTSRQQLGSQTSGSVPSARQKRAQQRSASVPRIVAEPLTFRNMSEKGAVPALTEKEKADRWDDLMERSERAGGTIHIGTSEQLASDEVSVRYSASSTQLLKDF